MERDGFNRLQSAMLLAATTFLPAVAYGLDALSVAAIDDPAAVSALEKLEKAGAIRWQPSATGPASASETLDWEGGGVIASATTGPVEGYSPDPEALQRSYDVFGWHYMARMIPGSRPRTGTTSKTISLAATPGEYEPAAFGVLALENLTEVCATPSDLRSEQADLIQASALDLRWVRYIPMPLEQRGTPEVWGLGPAVLVPMKEIDIPAGCAREAWLTVRVPDATPSGCYRGLVEVRAKGRPSTRLGVVLRVRPFRLGPPDPVVYAHYYNVPKDDDQMILEMTAAREHGCNSLTPVGVLHGRARADRDGHITSMDFSRADRFMDEFQRLGFRGPIPLMDLKVQGRGTLEDCTAELFLVKNDRHRKGSEEFFRCMREAVGLIRNHAEQRHWPDIYMYSSSELSRGQDVEGELIPFGIRLIKEMKSVGGVKVCASINGPDEPRFVRYQGRDELDFLAHLDLAMYNYGVPISDRTIAEARKHPGLVLWFQNIGTSRFTEGFMLWRAGVTGRRQYKLDGLLTDEGLLADAGIFYRLPGRILPTTDWECMRAGVDDMRYIRTLERAIENAKSQAEPAIAALAVEAEKRLQQIKTSIRIDMSRASVRRGQRPGLESPDRYDQYREDIAAMIERLSAAHRRS